MSQTFGFFVHLILGITPISTSNGVLREFNRILHYGIKLNLHTTFSPIGNLRSDDSYFIPGYQLPDSFCYFDRTSISCFSQTYFAVFRIRITSKVSFAFREARISIRITIFTNPLAGELADNNFF